MRCSASLPERAYILASSRNKKNPVKGGSSFPRCGGESKPNSAACSAAPPRPPLQLCTRLADADAMLLPA
ncbi:hypothetical protein NDU88_007726 [Pleurodeles waltl]|uniref:Uncharacterized protein n=1 Tax=Pleurodeles waltl TaxID=8319 RepID=A0AAV7QSH0_PLEWA|nr:hypothetical protein NDU88_007726 [Pleurodeles waltl]